jgi:O-antigen/teichoic acid export membrane protein
VASFYGEPQVQPLFAALSVSFLITALGTTQVALLTREMSFRSLELRIMLGTAVGGAVGIVIALEGGGAWAIIAQQIAYAAVSTILLWRYSAWKPRLLFSTASLRSFGGFSANVLGTRLLFYFNRNVDNILIGRFLGSAALGTYAVSYNVMLVPFSRLAEPVQEVLFPVFARLQDDARRVADAWVRVNRVIGALSIPALLGLMVVATDFVAVVLGDRWADAAPVIQILAWVGLMQSLQRLNSSILEARNRTSWLLGYSVVVLAGSLIAFGVGINWGILGVATAYAVSSTLIEPFYTLITARALGVSVWPFFRALGGVVQASAVMVVATVGARYLLLETGLGPAARLGIVIVVGIAVYVPLCAWRVPEVVRDLRSLRRRPPAVPTLAKIVA